MPDHAAVYDHQADEYECLIQREDHEHNILRQILKLTPLEGKDAADIGAGTGRLVCMLAPYVRSIHAFDLAPAMLAVTSAKLEAAGFTHWQTKVAEHRELPVPDASYDILFAGWTICYLASSNVDHWQANLNETMQEIRRVVRPGGTAVILETLGTGCTEPQPPEFLHGYFRLLEQKYGFTRAEIRTDYKFESVQEAERLTRFFFGDELAERVLQQAEPILPECTGIWWLKL